VDKKIISSPGTKPGGNYSQSIVIDGTLYISGQGDEDAAGKIPSVVDAGAHQSLDSIGAVLKAAGMLPPDVVIVQACLNHTGKVQRMNAVYASYFSDPRPTRTTVVVAGRGAGQHRNHRDCEEVARDEVESQTKRRNTNV
jgi:2-iminobutanoate/2-iminopropanoate deaminase